MLVLLFLFLFCFFLFWGLLCISLTQKCRLQTMNYFRVFGGLLFRNISNGQLLYKMLLYAIFVEHLIKLAPRWNRLTLIWWVGQCAGVLLCHILMLSKNYFSSPPKPTLSLSLSLSDNVQFIKYMHCTSRPQTPDVKLQTLNVFQKTRISCTIVITIVHEIILL